MIKIYNYKIKYLLILMTLLDLVSFFPFSRFNAYIYIQSVLIVFFSVNHYELRKFMFQMAIQSFVLEMLGWFMSMIFQQKIIKNFGECNFKVVVITSTRIINKY